MKVWHILLVAFVISTASYVEPVFAESLLVKTDKMFYKYGDNVVISGIAQYDNSFPLVIRAKMPNGAQSFVVVLDPRTDGTFNVTLPLQGPLRNETGMYNITATQFQNSTSLEFFETSSLSPLGTANFSNPQVVDLMGNKISFINEGKWIVVAANISNLNMEQPFAYFVSIVNSQGYQVSNAWITGTLTANVSLTPAQSWVPHTGGLYTAYLYLLKSVVNPILLANPLSLSIPVNGTNVSFGYSNSTASFGYSNSTATTIDIMQGSGYDATASCVAANNCFNPNLLKVTTGTTVTWKNNDNLSHFVVSGKPSDVTVSTVFDSTTLIKPRGGIYQFTFANVGTYDYFDPIHPWMTGSISVVNSVSSPTHSDVSPITNSLVSIINSNMSLVKNMSSSSMTNIKTVPSVTSSTTFNLSLMKQWAGMSAPQVQDSYLLQNMGLKGKHLPSWPKHMIPWIVSGDIQQQDFVNVIKYMNKTGLVK